MQKEMTMQHLRELGQSRALVRPAPEPAIAPAAAPSVKEIPYDYVAKFILKGEAGTRVEDVINISIEGVFVAVTIGYSFIPASLPAFTSRDVNKLGLTNNFLFNVLTQIGVNPLHTLGCLLVRLCGIQFKYSIVDSGTGRELQNQFIHNIAGLGESSGDRPFRPLAKPMVFVPRSTIRIAIEEISAGPLYKGAELFIVLHGYKKLGYGTALP
jgi:hypothetical protein